MKILQREYIGKLKRKRDFDSAIKDFQEKRSSLKTPNESFIYQKVLLKEGLSKKQRSKKPEGKTKIPEVYFNNEEAIVEEEGSRNDSSNTFSREATEVSFINEDRQQKLLREVITKLQLRSKSAVEIRHRYRLFTS